MAAAAFQLHFDNDTRRFILESRDPESGEVLVQIPPRDALEQLKALTGTEHRGGRLDSTA